MLRLAQLERKWIVEQQSRERSDAKKHGRLPNGIPPGSERLDPVRTRPNVREHRIVVEIRKILKRVLECTQSMLEHKTAVMSMQLIRSENQRGFFEQKLTRIVQKLADLELLIAKMMFAKQQQQHQQHPPSYPRVKQQELNELQRELKELRDTKIRLRNKCKLLSNELDRAKQTSQQHTGCGSPMSTRTQSACQTDDAHHQETVEYLRRDLALAETFQEELEEIFRVRDEKLAHLESSKYAATEAKRRKKEVHWESVDQANWESVDQATETDQEESDTQDTLQRILLLFGLEGGDDLESMLNQLESRKLAYETKIADLEAMNTDRVQRMNTDRAQCETRAQQEEWQQRIDALEFSRNDLRAKLCERDDQAQELQQALDALQSQMNGAQRTNADALARLQSQLRKSEEEKKGWNRQLATQLGLVDGATMYHLVSAIDDLCTSKKEMNVRFKDQEVILEEWNAYADKLERQWNEERVALESRCQGWEEAAIEWQGEKEDLLKQAETWKRRIDDLEMELSTRPDSEEYHREQDDLTQRHQQSQREVHRYRQELHKHEQRERQLELEQTILLAEFGNYLGGWMDGWMAN